MDEKKKGGRERLGWGIDERRDGEGKRKEGLPLGETEQWEEGRSVLWPVFERLGAS